MIKRGASLIWAVVLCSMLMLVSGTVASFVIKESKMSVRMDDSARAYAAAEAGLDWAKLCLLNQSCKNSFSSLGYKVEMDLAEAKYEVTVVENNGYIINSRGTSNSVNREIEYIFKEAAPDFVDLDPNADGDNTDDDFIIRSGEFTVPNSFTLDFTYWVDDTLSGSNNPLNDVNIGIKSSNLADNVADHVGVNIKETEIDLTVKDGGTQLPTTVALPGDYRGVTTYNSAIAIDSNQYDEPYALAISLKYIEGVSVRLTVRDDVNHECIGTKTVFLDDEARFDSFKTAAKFMFDGTGVTPIERISSDQIGMGDASNYLYRLTKAETPPTPSRVGYFDDFNSTGIVYVDGDPMRVAVSLEGSGTGRAVIFSPDGTTRTCTKSTSSVTNCTYVFRIAPGSSANYTITASVIGSSVFIDWRDYSRNFMSSSATIGSGTMNSTWNDKTFRATFN
jgi:Tfp pilus assembly protein PilX